MRRFMSMRHRVTLPLAAATASVARAGAAGAAPLAQLPAGVPPALGPFAEGTLVALRGTPHLWVVDARGLLHWGGDTRALQGRTVRGELRVEVTLDQLKTMARREPWLSSGLVKLGDPIYLPKWEVGQAQPTLFHIRDIKDVEFFGIDAGNYGALVLERAPWEARYPFKTDTLARDVLASAAGLGATPVADAWRPLGWEANGYTAYIPVASVVAQPQFAEPKPADLIDTHAIIAEVMRPGALLYFLAGWSLYKPDAMARYARQVADGTLDWFEDSRSSEFYRLASQRRIRLGAHDGLEARFELIPERRAEFAPVASFPTSLVGRVYVAGGRFYLCYAIYPEDERSLQDAARFLDSFAILG